MARLKKKTISASVKLKENKSDVEIAKIATKAKFSTYIEAEATANFSFSIGRCQNDLLDGFFHALPPPSGDQPATKCQYI